MDLTDGSARMRTAVVLVAMSGTLSGVGGRRSEGAERFDVVSVLYTRSPQVFTQLFSRARCGTVRGLILGDSQEATPGGLGVVYTPRLNYELWRVYGNAPSTPLFTVFSSSGGGSPWADWLVSTGTAAPGLGPPTLTPSQLPPSVTAATSCTPNGNNINNNQWHGQLATISFNAARVDPNAAIPTDREYFRRGTECMLDVYALAKPGSGDIWVAVKPTTDGRNNFYAPTIATLTGPDPLDGGETRIVKQRIGPLPFGGRAFMQIELAGTRADRTTELIGGEFLSLADARGVTLTTFSQGGYTAGSFGARHANCGPFLTVFAPDFVIMTYGANDSGSRSATQYRADLEELIAMVRNATRPDLPVILIADPYRIGISPEQADQLDRYPGACLAIAEADPLVCALNSRRILDGYGWNASGFRAFVSDAVHLTPAGAILKARVEIETLAAAFARPSPCAADVDADCGVGIDDLLVFLAAFERGEPVADLDDGSGTGTTDGGVDINDLLYFLVRFDAGC